LQRLFSFQQDITFRLVQVPELRLVQQERRQ
jgi:hypothetical protein